MSSTYGRPQDFKIFDDVLQTRNQERVAQVVNAFNQASGGAILLAQEGKTGDYAYESFFKAVDGVGRRDPNSTSALTDIRLSGEENITVKLHRTYTKNMLVSALMNMFPNASPEEISFYLGENYADEKLKDMLNRVLIAGVAALTGETTNKLDITNETTKTVNHASLVKSMAKLGDKGTEISALVMHSKPYYDLMGNAISDKIYDVGSNVIYSGSVATFGRPVIVTDSPALINEASTDTYNTLLLTPGALKADVSTNEVIFGELVSGLANLLYRQQNEYTYNVGVKGFKWDTSNGGANPTDANLGTSGNWDKSATSHKDLAGVVLISQ